MSFWKPLTLSEDFANAFSKLEASPTISTLILQARGVYKLDLPCKDADSAASADDAAYGMDHAEKLRGCRQSRGRRAALNASFRSRRGNGASSGARPS
jgi:hypothetical protein